MASVGYAEKKVKRIIRWQATAANEYERVQDEIRLDREGDPLGTTQEIKL